MAEIKLKSIQFPDLPDTYILNSLNCDSAEYTLEAVDDNTYHRLMTISGPGTFLVMISLSTSTIVAGIPRIIEHGCTLLYTYLDNTCVKFDNIIGNSPYIRVKDVVKDVDENSNDVYIDIAISSNVQSTNTSIKCAVVGTSDLFSIAKQDFPHAKSATSVSLIPQLNEVLPGGTFKNLIVDDIMLNSYGSDPFSLVEKVQDLEDKNESIQDSIESLTDRIRYGTDLPTVALADAPEGTIYIQYGTA